MKKVIVIFMFCIFSVSCAPINSKFSVFTKNYNNSKNSEKKEEKKSSKVIFKVTDEDKISIEGEVCLPDDESVEVEIKDADGHKTLKKVKCPEQKKVVEEEEEVLEIPTVVKLIGEKVEKNYFFGNISYRLVSEEGVKHHVPTFGGGFQSYPFIKGKAGVKLSLGYGIPANPEGWRHMMEWKLLTYVKIFKDVVNLNIGYYGSMSWGNVVSRNESGALVEMEYFVDKNKHVSVTIGGVIGSAIDYFYGDTWKLSGGLIVGSSVRF